VFFSRVIINDRSYTALEQHNRAHFARCSHAMPRSSGPYDGGKEQAHRAHGAEVNTESSQTHALEKDRLMWEKFMRTLKPNAVRSSRLENMPEHLAPSMTTKEGNKRWFRLWLENGCSWKQLAAEVGEESPAGA